MMGLRIVFLLIGTWIVFTSCDSEEQDQLILNEDGIVLDVDMSLFLEGTTVSTIPCTLSDGTVTDCYQITTTSTASDHQMGPWCPSNISDGEEAGGIWLESGQVYDVDGAFIKNLATFYNDNTWMMYDENGDIYITATEEDCINAANPDVGAEYQNFCVECLPSYITDLAQSWVIPITPIKQSNASNFAMGGGPTGVSGPTVRGIAFNGIEFSGAAPTDAILSAYTLAPFDDAGGHINVHQGYHYHAATGVSTEVSQLDGHAPMIGYAMDGHSIHTQLNEDGSEPSDLDQCRGHYDETRGYHYHVDAAGNNNFINCLAGAYVN